MTARHGEWESPIDAATAASHDGSPDALGTVGPELWWTAPRPAEGGRRALMRLRQDGTVQCPLPPPWNVRNRVMEYGGTPWGGALAGGEPLVVFTHHADQRLYAFRPDRPQEPPYPLSPLSAVGGGLRWAEPAVHPGRGEVWAVLEEFTGEGPSDLRRLHAALPLDGSAAEDRAAVREMAPPAHRFVTGLRLSPDGGRAVWLAWDHPRMPWDGTELRIADVRGDGVLGPARTLIGGPDESVAQAEWAQDGTLLAATDRTGWWNVHRVDPSTGDAVNLCPREEEFAGPLWKLGQRWFAPLPHGPVAVLHGVGAQRLAVLDPSTGTLTDAPGPWTEWSATLAVSGPRVAGSAASAHSAHEIVQLDTTGTTGTTGTTDTVGADGSAPGTPGASGQSGASGPFGGSGAVRASGVVGPGAVAGSEGVPGLRGASGAPGAVGADGSGAAVSGASGAPPASGGVGSAAAAGASGPSAASGGAARARGAAGRVSVLGEPHRDVVDPRYLPEPAARVFAGPGGREVHAQVYPPRHPDHGAGDGPAPYVVWVHGGPTSRAAMVLDLELAYFTTRGLGVAEVNYGGSTGYGRAYRNRLREQWGVVDVEDCVAVAEGLVAEGAADPARLAIRGGSAGGWTTAAALTTTRTFACGAISYPILDLAGWSPAGGETHDFEAWYLESLVGPHLEVPERYRDRSPVHLADRVTAPFLLLQGLDDVICPPVQCERFLAALQGRGVPHAYLTFAGESHGFRRLDTLVTCLEAELSLYGQVFGFDPPGVPALDLRT